MYILRARVSLALRRLTLGKKKNLPYLVQEVLRMAESPALSALRNGMGGRMGAKPPHSSVYTRRVGPRLVRTPRWMIVPLAGGMAGTRRDDLGGWRGALRLLCQA